MAIELDGEKCEGEMPPVVVLNSLKNGKEVFGAPIVSRLVVFADPESDGYDDLRAMLATAVELAIELPPPRKLAPRVPTPDPSKPFAAGGFQAFKRKWQQQQHL